MKSIKTKISVLVIACAFISAAAISVLSLTQTNEFIERDSREIINNTCRETAESLDAYLGGVEQSVDTLADFVLYCLTDVGSFISSDENVDSLTDMVSPVLLTAAEHTNGAMSAYIRYNPDIAYPTSGKFYTKASEDSPYQVIENTDLSAYDKDDLNHVGWYYIPVNNGAPIWMEPYLNENINVYMISYVVPLFKDGMNIGILGMDIDFSFFVHLANAGMLYDDPAFFVTDRNNNILFHKDYDYGVNLADIDPNGGTRPLIDALTSGTSVNAPLTSVRYGGARYQTSYQTLRNGMNLILSVPDKSVNSRKDTLFVTMAVIALAAVAVAAVAAVFISGNMAKPIKKLSETAKRIAEGNLDAEINIASNDEIGELANNFSSTVRKLHDYVGYIREVADILNSIAGGDLDFTLTKDYSGEFEKIKISLENISETLNTAIAAINEAAVEVAQGSVRVSDGAQSLAQSSIQQTESIEGLSSSINSLTNDVVQNNKNIHNAFDAMEKAVVSINESSGNMSEMQDAMNAISDASEKIGNIVKTVDDIALQTNILAINAAIEAGRAGEAGRGFSVVSEEIQTLASKTSAATNEINDLVENVIKTVENGRVISDKAERSIQSVSETAVIIQSTLSKISESGDKQSDSIESINSNIRQISDIVRDNTATAEESASASENMSTQANLLHEKISIFKLKHI